MPRTSHRRRRLGLAAVALAGALGCRAVQPAAQLVLLVTVDTLRADRLGAYGGELELTPALDALAARSVVFEAAYAPAPVTLPSVAALLTGRYPQRIGVRSNASLVPAVPTLASEFRARGFATGAVVSSLVLRERAGLALGFDHYDDELPQQEAVRGWPERVAPETTRAALRVLDELLGSAGGGVFLWVHYQDPHGPYQPPEALRQAYLPAERGAPDGLRLLPVQQGDTRLGAIPAYQALGDERQVAFYRAGYDGEVRLTDQAIGALLAGVEERGLAERAVIVFTADHGESLGEGDFWFAHGEHLTDPLVRVPLLIRLPGTVPARRGDVASLVDLYPTLLAAAAGGAVPAIYPGRNLLAPGAPSESSVAYLAAVGGGRVRRVGVVRNHFKYVAVRRGEQWEGTLFRVAPPGLETPVRSAPLEQTMQQTLQEAIRRLGPQPEERRQELSARDRAQLEALGYGE